MKVCPNCNATNDDTAQFCNLCLEKFGAGESAYQASEQSAPEAAPATEYYDSRYVSIAPESTIKTKQRSVLLPSYDLLSNALAFFMENIKFYMLLSVVLSAFIVLAFFTIGGSMLPSVMNLAEGNATPQSMAQLSSGFIWSMTGLVLLVGVLGLSGQLAFMVATVEMSKGYELSAFAAIALALRKIFSFLWIACLQSAIIGAPMFLGGLLATATQSPVPMIISMILGIPIALIVGTWFSLAVYVYLDNDTRGLAALTASKDLIGSRWPNVTWRFFVLGLVITVLNAIPLIGWLVSSFVATPLATIFPWLLYSNLKALSENENSVAGTTPTFHSSLIHSAPPS